MFMPQQRINIDDGKNIFYDEQEHIFDTFHNTIGKCC
jgi:hypothetical protein